jgi:long-chain alkane monooxygenase
VARPFHLGWFTYFGPDEWDAPFASAGGSPWDGAFHTDLARALERACFDLVLLEDSLAVSAEAGGTRELLLRTGVRAPRHDPAPLAALMAAATRHLGVVTTLSTLLYPPFLLARLLSTLDSLSGGRAGWNIVTSTDDAEARNAGLPALPDRDERYAAAQEHVDVVTALLDGWEPGAVVMDRATHTYADHTRVHAVDAPGPRYPVAGPLTTVRSPQGRPLYCQAGGSPTGRAFAARNADLVLAVANGPAAMKEARDDVRRRAEQAGRDPDAVRVLFLVAPVLGETEGEARAALERSAAHPTSLATTLAKFSAYTGVDLTSLDLDAPLPPPAELLAGSARGSVGTLTKFAQVDAEGRPSAKPLRQLAADAGTNSSLDLVGTPEQVADQLEAAAEEVGGDGFLVTTPFHRLSRHYVVQVTEGLVPVLQRRGLVRTRYAAATLRGHLTEF